MSAPLDELPGGKLLDAIRDMAALESSRIYRDQAFYVERGLQDTPAVCQIEKADLLAGIQAIALSLKAEGVELETKRQAGTFAKNGRPVNADITREELIGRLIKTARAEIKIQRQKREPKHDEQFAADIHDPDQVEA